jgi:hypothetical protein
MRTLITVLLCLITLAAAPLAMAADGLDEGYFLAMAQKGHLIWNGRIQDGRGDWYDVWVVPGYVAPSRIAREGLHDTGADFGEYFAAEKYRDLADDSGDAYRWAFKDALYDFTLKGTPRAWGKHFAAAQNRCEQRVFGWWFAYPWAFFTSVTDNVFRIPAGLAGIALGTVWGTAVVPTWYLTNSTAKGLWHSSTSIILVPVAGYAWNTVIAPPLSLLGQKPAPSRVDGFWVRRLSDAELQQAEAATVPLQEEDYARIEAWGRLLQSETQPYHERMAAIDAKANAAILATNKQREEQLKTTRAEAHRQVKLLLQQTQQQELVTQLRGETAGRMQQQPWRDGLRQRLATKGMAPESIERLLSRISTYQDDLNTVVRPLEKTDPLKEIVTAPEQL